MKERIIGYDILRIVGVFAIFCYHFINIGMPYGAIGVYNTNVGVPFAIFVRPACIFLLMISGFALMYNNEQQLSAKNFYVRRFKSLMIPFYVAYVLMMGIGVVLLRWRPWRSTPKLSFVYTIFGIDGLMANYQSNFYLVGEWFMSCIVICYLLFPLLALCYKTKWSRYVTLIVLGAVYLALMLIGNPFKVNSIENPLFVLFYFYLGMLLKDLIAEKAIPHWLSAGAWMCGVTVYLIILFSKLGVVLPRANYSQNALEGLYFIQVLSLFIALRSVGRTISDSVKKIILYLSKISWQVILIHHVMAVIYFALCGGLGNVMIDFVIVLFLTLILAEICGRISNFIKKKAF
ncbi:Peptidoglycan/LPS O-acetylase OafA/YrhL, contains acyltransferase and SGNH-hydrolase domains [Pseudobutyrivibrio sp. YE44]|uniref:acyltransferase family protein n=1 Tax=Pseudobutyrivibrio sp. YE44 TaxID=1520802 RepID=UPI0008887643|nr:acyltransferase [Pseudobutyrivibrio sp. YE44]SDB21701.1 Peptidoglycan/LPS O-acetylase OafA/YrhL, contains acyltransferase and SGNH-hydrolase domains [Pseudobutyrivibrio sp. YE44]